MMFELKKLCKFSLFATIVAISGCGGEEDQSIPSPTPESTPMIVMDGFSTVTPKTKAFIDLSPFIRGSDVRISGVYTDSSNAACGTPTVQGRGINVEIEEGAYCQFTYSAQQIGLPHAKASLNVLATEAPEPTLPPISQAMVLGGASAKFNIQALLGADWKDSYTLNTASVQVQGMEGNLGAVNAAGNIISFTPPELSGWNRIIFTLDDAETPEASVVGAVYVTISEAVNQSPQIGEPKYDYGANHTSLEDKVFMGESKTLNLETLTGLNISEPDGQEWQLVSVQSFTASVSAASPNSVTNKSFEFLAPTIGDHYVSYIIADHYGGYSAGLIKMTVFAKGGVPTWADITTGGNTYSAPKTYEQATEIGYIVSPLWDEPVKNTVAGFTASTANRYCATLGNTPSVAELEALRYAGDELTRWPLEHLYIAYDKGKLVGFNLNNGEVIASSGVGSDYYVTCIIDKTTALQMLKYSLVADGNVNTIAKVITPLNSEGFTVEQVDGSLAPEDVNLELGEKSHRTTPLYMSGIKEGTYRFAVQNSSDSLDRLISGTINFVGDAKTGMFDPISGLFVNKNNATPDGSDENIITVTLTDANANKVIGAKIAIEVKAVAPELGDAHPKYTIEPSNGITDNKGQVKVLVTSRSALDVDVTAIYQGRQDGMEMKATTQVTFKPVRFYPCGGTPCVPVQESTLTEGVLFAAPPTIAWAKMHGEHDNIIAAGYKPTTDTFGNRHGNLYEFGIKTYGRELSTQPSCEHYNRTSTHGRTNWVPLTGRVFNDPRPTNVKTDDEEEWIATRKSNFADEEEGLWYMKGEFFLRTWNHWNMWPTSVSNVGEAPTVSGHLDKPMAAIIGWGDSNHPNNPFAPNFNPTDGLYPDVSGHWIYISANDLRVKKNTLAFDTCVSRP